MREILVDENGKNPVHFTTYDTSGPYTDPSIEINIKKGIPKLERNGY